MFLTSGRRYFLRRFTTATLGGSASLGSLQSSVAPIRKSSFIFSMPLKRKSTSLAWFPSPLSMGCFLRWRYFLLTRSLKEAALYRSRFVTWIVTNSSVMRLKAFTLLFFWNLLFLLLYVFQHASPTNSVLQKPFKYQNVQLFKDTNSVYFSHFYLSHFWKYSAFCKIFPIHPYGEFLKFHSATTSAYIQL